MAKKVSYHTALRLQMSDLIEQLDLSDFYKQSLRERWLDQMIWADKKAGQNQKRHYRLRLTTIVGGVILPALVGISIQLGPTNPFARDWFPGLTFALSQIIAVSATIEEFCRYGDRWREYRQMAEDLKTEGWQYLQLTGPYQPNRPWGAEVEAQDPLPRSRSYDRERLVRPTIERRSGRDHATGNRHLESYPRFANRVESIIKNDVKSYMAGLAQQQAQQEARVEEILAQAQSAAQDRNLLNQTNPALALPPYPNAPGYAVPGYSSYPPGAVMPTYLSAPGYGAMPQMPTYPPASGYGVPQPNEAPGFAPAPSPAPPISGAERPCAPPGSLCANAGSDDQWGNDRSGQQLQFGDSALQPRAESHRAKCGNSDRRPEFEGDVLGRGARRRQQCLCLGPQPSASKSRHSCPGRQPSLYAITAPGVESRTGTAHGAGAIQSRGFSGGKRRSPHWHCSGGWLQNSFIQLLVSRPVLLGVQRRLRRLLQRLQHNLPSAALGNS